MISNTERPYEEQNYEHFMGYDRFKFVGDLFSEYLEKNKDKDSIKVLDIGCANGAFIYYLKKRFPNENIEYSGIEYLQGFVDIAKQEEVLKDVNFYCDDAETFSLDETFDVVLMQGVLSYFDNCDAALNNIYNHLAPGGLSLIFGIFNHNDIDLLTKFRLNEVDPDEWHSGYNIHALKTFDRYFNKRGVSSIKNHKFTMTTDLSPSETNKLAGYTLTTKEVGKIVVNGLCLINNFYVVEINK